MQSNQFVAYFRVSTAKQGVSGLGLEAQQNAIRAFLGSSNGSLVGEYQEVESGGNDDRAELEKAIRTCKLKDATLLIAKLDRLSRDVHFITSLQKQGVNFVCADMPHANQFTIHIMAAMGEQERKLISERTRSALAEKKKQGVKLGNPNLDAIRNTDTHAARNGKIKKSREHQKMVWKEIETLVKDGKSLEKIVDYLDAKACIKTIRGNRWTKTGVSRIIQQFSKPKLSKKQPRHS